VFNAPRFIAFLGPLFAGTLIVQFGGFGQAAMILACIYFLGFEWRVLSSARPREGTRQRYCFACCR
jgi:hypothetical protein